MSSSPPHVCDRQLLKAIAHHDERAFGQLVLRHQDRIRRLCLVLLGNAARADEVAQEAFLALWKTRTRYAQATNPLGLLYAIARNRCLKELRRRRLARFVGWDDTENTTPQTVEPCHGPEEQMGEAQEKALLRTALAELPEKFRTPITLRFIEGVDYPTVAAAIGCNESTTRSRVHFGLKALARKLPPELRPWQK